MLVPGNAGRLGNLLDADPWIRSFGIAVNEEQVARIEGNRNANPLREGRGFCPQGPKVRPLLLQGHTVAQSASQDPRQMVEKSTIERTVSEQGKS